MLPNHERKKTTRDQKELRECIHSRGNLGENKTATIKSFATAVCITVGVLSNLN